MLKKKVIVNIIIGLVVLVAASIGLALFDRENVSAPATPTMGADATDAEVSSTPTPVPTNTPVVITPTPTPTEIPYVKPEDTMVTVGNKGGKTVSVSTHQYVLDLSGIKIKDVNELKRQLDQLPLLLYVDMCDCGLTDEQMEDLMETFPAIKFVWKLHLTCKNNKRTLNWYLRTDSLAFSTLHVYEDDPRIDNTEGQKLKYCTDLVALDLGHNSVHDTEFMKDMNMHILITVDCYNRAEQHRFNSLGVAKNFKNLMYFECFVGAIKDFSPIKDCKEIRDLNISFNPVSEITYLKDFPKLERFVMEETNISKEDYEELCKIYPDVKIVRNGWGSVDQGWRSHPRYKAMMAMFKQQNYWDDLFRTEDELKELASRDLLIVNGVRYYGTPYTLNLPDDAGDPTKNTSAYTLKDKYGNSYAFRNKIASTVGKDNIPEENGACNFDGVGNFYTPDNGKGVIVVLMPDGKYHFFYKNEVLATLLNTKLEKDGETKKEYRRREVEKVHPPKPIVDDTSAPAETDAPTTPTPVVTPSVTPGVTPPVATKDDADKK